MENRVQLQRKVHRWTIATRVPRMYSLQDQRIFKELYIYSGQKR